jgi:hypothetical protein
MAMAEGEFTRWVMLYAEPRLGGLVAEGLHREAGCDRARPRSSPTLPKDDNYVATVLAYLGRLYDSANSTRPSWFSAAEAGRTARFAPATDYRAGAPGPGRRWPGAGSGDRQGQD